MHESAQPIGGQASGTYRRIAALDVLRGVAILGILVMNVRNFALPLGEFQRPSLAGGLSIGNVAAWALADVLFEDKMIALLSLLFGAGLVLMHEHAIERGEPFARRWFARCAWLLVFGVVHALAVWYGDILNTYAVAGLLLFFVRKWPARRLVWLGVAVLAIYPVIGLATMDDAPVETMRSRLARPVPPPDPTAPPAAEEVALGGTYGQAVAWHWDIFFRWHVEGAYVFNLWRCAGLMLFGMALAKTRFFVDATPRLRKRLLFVGYGIGLPLALVVVATLYLRDLRLARVELGIDATRLAWPLFLQRWLQYLSGILMGLGHAALLVGWCARPRDAAESSLQGRLAAAGRMALSNYLVQSLVCTTLFYGWGFGLFGELSMLALSGIVVAIATAQLLTSPWWLARFSMGPFEWAWRSLTLGRRLPLRREAVPAPAL